MNGAGERTFQREDEVANQQLKRRKALARHSKVSSARMSLWLGANGACIDLAIDHAA